MAITTTAKSAWLGGLLIWNKYDTATARMRSKAMRNITIPNTYK